MDCYRQVTDMEIWSRWWNKTEILPSSSRVSTIVWLHYFDFNEALGEKVRLGYKSMLRAILNKPGRQHHIKQHQKGHLPPISQNIEVRRARQARHCWRSKEKLISDVHEWTTTYGHTSVDQLAKNYINQLCAKSGCHLADLPRTRADKNRW